MRIETINNFFNKRQQENFRLKVLQKLFMSSSDFDRIIELTQNTESREPDKDSFH